MMVHRRRRPTAAGTGPGAGPGGHDVGMNGQVTLRPPSEDDLAMLEELTQDPEQTGEFGWFGGPTVGGDGGAGMRTACSARMAGP
jgi:hypothetical protein